MFRKLKERKWANRAEKYLLSYPEHEPIVKTMLMANVVMKQNYGPRECAELLLSRELTEQEWKSYKDPWQKAHLYIFG